MAWNSRVVKTYGRQPKRMIISEPAWISPETVAGSVFSPDTDVSATSSRDRSNGDPKNHRHNKQTESNPLITPLGKVDESDKENMVSLAPETPEEVQGPRRRGLRNCRKITIKRKQEEEGTPRLFSSDSDDGVRKIHGRKVLQKTDNNLCKPVLKKGHKRSTNHPTSIQGTPEPRKPLKKSTRRVKNVIENDIFSVVRSPPARGHRASKRYRCDKQKSESSTSFNASMSPFAIMESWIDSIKDIQTSTPMVALVKLNIGDKIKQGTVECGNNVGKCIKHKQPGSCKCSNCQEAQEVACRIFELTLSDEEEGPRNGHATRGALRTKKLDKCHKISKSLSVESCTEKELLNGESRNRLRTRQRGVKYKDTTDDDDMSSGAESRVGRRGLRNNRSKKDGTDDDNIISEEECSRTRHGLRNRQKSVNATDEDNVISEEESNRTRRGLRNRHDSLNYKSTTDDDNNVSEEEPHRTRHGLRNKHKSGNHSDSSHEDNLKPRRKASQRTSQENPTVDNAKQISSSGANCSVVLGNLSSNDIEANLKGPTVTLKGLSPNDISSHLCDSSVVIRGMSPQDLERHRSTSVLSESDNSTNSRDSSISGLTSEGSLNVSVSLHPLSKKLQEMHLSSDADVEDAGQDVRNEEEDRGSEPMSPRTPCNRRNQRLASFHADSFKEVFTPKKHKITGLEITGKEKVLLQCEQTDIISFTECIPPAMMRKCTKIGEGVYGEVFRTTNSKRQPVALKIIPIEGDFEVNEEPQKTFEEILPEIVISRELSYLKDSEFNYTENYIHVNNVSCCVGKYPKTLLTEWDRYDERKESENDRPDIFGDDQLYIIFEFDDGGQDLEGFEFTNLNEAVSVLQQIAGALAVAELDLSFEHRDLHWGNVLIRSTEREYVGFRLGDETYSIESHGLEVSIIDFTLSRLTKDDCTIFCDLAVDPTLFDGTGDYQFDMYRKMKEENNNNWEPFHPHSNVLWLHYLTDKLLKTKTYKNRGDRKLMIDLRAFYRNLLGHASAEEVVRESDLLTL